MQPPNSKQATRYPVADEMRVYFGDSPDVWRHTMIRNGYGPAIMLPPGYDFTQYKWPVRGRDVLMLQIGEYQESVLQPFCKHLVIEGATVVRVVYGSQLSVFRPEASYVNAA